MGGFVGADAAFAAGAIRRTLAVIQDVFIKAFTSAQQGGDELCCLTSHFLSFFSPRLPRDPQTLGGALIVGRCHFSPPPSGALVTFLVVVFQ